MTTSRSAEREADARRARPCGAARTTGGSGRLRIAAAIVIVLTRQAENATTTSVSSTPSAKAMRRLCQVKAYCDLEAGVLVLGAERARHHEHHPVGDDRPEERADGCGDEVVGGALER